MDETLPPRFQKRNCFYRNDTFRMGYIDLELDGIKSEYKSWGPCFTDFWLWRWSPFT